MLITAHEQHVMATSMWMMLMCVLYPGISFLSG